ncbi:hypothetical protein [Nocardia sp. NPDC004711]
MSANSIDFVSAEEDPAVVAVAREWLQVCKNDFGEWPEITADELTALSPGQVVSLVHQGWGGGLPAFLADCAVDITDHRAANSVTNL